MHLSLLENSLKLHNAPQHSESIISRIQQGFLVIPIVQLQITLGLRLGESGTRPAQALELGVGRFLTDRNRLHLEDFLAVLWNPQRIWSQIHIGSAKAAVGLAQLGGSNLVAQTKALKGVGRLDLVKIDFIFIFIHGRGDDIALCFYLFQPPFAGDRIQDPVHIFGRAGKGFVKVGIRCRRASALVDLLSFPCQKTSFGHGGGGGGGEGSDFTIPYIVENNKNELFVVDVG
jgi:hypothetical protein